MTTMGWVWLFLVQQAYCEAEFFRSKEGVDFFLGAPVVAEAEPYEEKPFERPTGPNGETFFLTEPYVVEYDSAEITLKTASYDPNITGDLFFIEPHPSNKLVKVLSFPPKDNTNRKIHLGYFPKGSELVFMYMYQNESEKGVRLYTGRNQPGFDRYISDKAHPLFDYRWAIMGRISRDTTQFNFELIEKTNFKDLVFHVTQKDLNKNLSSPIIVDCLKGSASYKGYLAFFNPDNNNRPELICDNKNQKSVNLGRFEKGFQFNFMYHTPEMEHDSLSEQDSLNIIEFLDTLTLQNNLGWAAGQADDSTIMVAFEDGADNDFDDFLIKIHGTLQLQRGLQKTSKSFSQDSILVVYALWDINRHKLSVDEIVTVKDGRITGIDLSNQSLQKFPALLFRLGKLESLNLSNNLLSSLPNSPETTPLQTILLNENQICSDEINSFEFWKNTDKNFPENQNCKIPVTIKSGFEENDISIKKIRPATLVIEGIPNGGIIEIFATDGSKLATQPAAQSNLTISIPKNAKFIRVISLSSPELWYRIPLN